MLYPSSIERSLLRSLLRKDYFQEFIITAKSKTELAKVSKHPEYVLHFLVPDR